MIRLQDIADMAGVSRTTVSNVINGNTKRVSQETIDKITRILKEQNYVPHMGSVMLSGHGSRIIGVVLGFAVTHGMQALQDSFVGELVGTIQTEAERNGYFVMLIGGEKIDIIEYSDDPQKYISAALSPAKVLSVEITDLENKNCRVTVPDGQLSLAIGNKGQNARLAARLTGWKIDIRPESGFFGEDEEDEKLEVAEDTTAEDTLELDDTAEENTEALDLDGEKTAEADVEADENTNEE